MVSQESAGVELRFVTEANSFRVSLSCEPSVLVPYEYHHPEVVIFRGAFFHSCHRLELGRINHISVVNIPESNPFDLLTTEASSACGFSPQVWRIFLGRHPFIFHGLDTYGFERRPPEPGELPSRRWIAYGSSITNGAAPTVHENSYIYHAARLASLDVCNQGLSGSCLCEPEMAEYLAGRDDWDVMTLELGVNMRASFSPEEFRNRAGSLVDAICCAHPTRKVVLITIFPNAASIKVARNRELENSQREELFNAILRDLPKRHKNLSLLEGADILDDFGGLSVDLVHPSDFGHARMGANLGVKLKQLLASE
jgi:hypothetical protein